MGLGELFMRGFRLIFRDQRTRLQIDWLTHTDEQILEWIEENGASRPAEIARSIGRSDEYVADRCRQLVLRGLLDIGPGGGPTTSEYQIADLGARYLRGQIDAEALESVAGDENDT